MENSKSFGWRRKDERELFILCLKLPKQKIGQKVAKLKLKYNLLCTICCNLSCFLSFRLVLCYFLAAARKLRRLSVLQKLPGWRKLYWLGLKSRPRHKVVGKNRKQKNHPSHAISGWFADISARIWLKILCFTKTIQCLFFFLYFYHFYAIHRLTDKLQILQMVGFELRIFGIW